MSEFREYEFKAFRNEEGEILLEQDDGVDETNWITLTPEQLVRLGEWAKAWVNSRGAR